MAKLEDASDDVMLLFNEVRENTSIPDWVEFLVFCNNKQKNEVCKPQKFNEISEKASNGINYVIIINEEILDSLPDEMKKMVIDECLAGITIKENDTLSLSKPDFNTYTGVLQKYGDEKVLALHESIKSLYDEKKQKEEQERAERAGKRGRKPRI